MPTPPPPQHLIDLAHRAHAAGAPAHVLRGHVVEHVQREAAREEAVEHAMALVDALYETPGAPKVRLWTGLASGGAPRVYFPEGYVTVNAEGSIGGASIQPGLRRQVLTFSESSLYPSQRQAYKKALNLYRAGLLERAEEQALARAERIEDLVAYLDAAVAGEEDDEHIERQAERAAWQARHEEGRGNPDARITEEEARKKMKGEQGVFRALDQGARGICTAFEYPAGGVYALHRRRDGKIQGHYHYPPREWEAPRAFVDESPFAPRRNPRIGKMMEAFADLLKTKEDRDPPRPFIEDGKARIDLTYGKRDYEGDLDLDILRLKVGRSFVAAAAGELGSRVFAEHNTFTAPKHRGKGYMHLLYTTLLKDGIGIVSDKWNHSLPMRKVWMRLARDGWPVYAFTDEGEDVGGYTMTRIPPDVTQDDPLLDEVLVVAPNMDAFSRIFDEYELDEGVGEHLRGGADSVYEGDEDEDD